MVLLFLLPSCNTVRTGGVETTSPYEVPGTFEATGLTETDRELTRRIQKNHEQPMTPKKEFQLLARVLGFISRLQTEQVEDRVRGTGHDLTKLLRKNEAPSRFLGHWYRLRGTPVSVPQQRPYQGKLDVPMDLQQFLLKNPFVGREKERNTYYEIISLKPLSNLRTSDRILEVDGLLWKTWSISPRGNSRFTKTNQIRIPVFLITNYRVVKEQ